MDEIWAIHGLQTTDPKWDHIQVVTSGLYTFGSWKLL